MSCLLAGACLYLTSCSKEKIQPTQQQPSVLHEQRLSGANNCTLAYKKELGKAIGAAFYVKYKNIVDANIKWPQLPALNEAFPLGAGAGWNILTITRSSKGLILSLAGLAPVRKADGQEIKAMAKVMGSGRDLLNEVILKYWERVAIQGRCDDLEEVLEDLRNNQEGWHWFPVFLSPTKDADEDTFPKELREKVVNELTRVFYEAYEQEGIFLKNYQGSVEGIPYKWSKDDCYVKFTCPLNIGKQLLAFEGEGRYVISSHFSCTMDELVQTAIYDYWKKVASELTYSQLVYELRWGKLAGLGKKVRDRSIFRTP